jgi:hypothetical protein
MSEYKAPGVYIEETGDVPVTLPQSPTGIPVFVGYIGRDVDGGLAGVPVRIASFREFEDRFGKAPKTRYDFSLDKTGAPDLTAVAASRFLLQDAIRLFLENFHGCCWVLPVKESGTDEDPVVRSPSDFGDEVWKVLETLEEPDLLVLPDAVLMPREECYSVYNAALHHCADVGNRFAILDVHDGDKPRSGAFEDDVISGQTGFRSLIAADGLSFGAAYYPWVKTSLRRGEELSLAMISPETRPAALDFIEKDPAVPLEGSTRILFDETLALARADDVTDEDLDRAADVLMKVSPACAAMMKAMQAKENILPPSGAIAGTYAGSDANVGIWKAPANIALDTVVEPCVDLHTGELEDLYAPGDGKAVNPIRHIPGRGTLAWGARTLDGNSLDWRYIQIRRLMSYIEQSIKTGMRNFVFSPNNAQTWAAVKQMIESFLTGLWKEGALLGKTPDDAFRVVIGLGSTMTDEDILNGYMRVVAYVSPLQPQEFIALTVEQRMLDS